MAGHFFPCCKSILHFFRYFCLHKSFFEWQRSSYELGDDEFSDDSVPMQMLISDLDSFFKSFNACLSPSSYEAFVAMVTSEIAIHMEKVLLKTKFNRVSAKIGNWRKVGLLLA